MRSSEHRDELALLTCLLALLIIACDSGHPLPNSASNYAIPNEVALTALASRDESNGVVISGTINLPDGTKLGIELMKGRRAAAQDFSVFAESGKFHSAGFRKGISPLPPGKQKIHIFTYFTNMWQSPTVLNVLGTGGSKLKPSAVIRSEDAQLIDGDKVLDYTADLIIPPLRNRSSASETGRLSHSNSREAEVIEIVKKAVRSWMEAGHL